MIADQFDTDGIVTDILSPIPHASTGMIGSVNLMQNSINRPIACHQIVGVPTTRQRSQPTLQTRFRTVNDNIVGGFTTAFIELSGEFVLVYDKLGPCMDRQRL